MRFKRDREAETLMAVMLGKDNADMLVYSCKAGDWQFVVTYDGLHKHWTASWQTHIVIAGKRYSSQSCEPPEPGQKFKSYETQYSAEQACLRKYRELRANN